MKDKRSLRFCCFKRRSPIPLFLVIAPMAIGLFFMGMRTAKSNYGIPFIGEFSALYVATDSMEGDFADSLPQGTGVIIRRIDPSELVEGDIVSFYDGKIDAVNTHRLVEAPRIHGGRYWLHTKGDNQQSARFSYEGEHFGEGAYIGKVIAHSDFISYTLASFSPQVSAMAESMGRKTQALMFPLCTLLPLGALCVFTCVATVKEIFLSQEKDDVSPRGDSFSQQILETSL